MPVIELNQRKSNRGGKRPGAGRKPGSANVKTREIADKAAAEGLTPVEFLLSIMRDETADRRERMSCAVAAAPYIHPKLAAIEHTGKDGGAIETDNRWTVELVSAKADAS